MNATLISLEKLEALVAAKFMRHGASEDNAMAAAKAVVAAEASGQKGHGLSRIESYAAQLDVGKINGQAKAQILHQNAGRLVIDAQNGFAYRALDMAAELLPQMAISQGIAAAAITHSHHAGALGVLAKKMADRGCLTLIFANTPKAMAAYGGSRALFGTNPIAFAAPRQGKDSLVIDLALSKVARGKILNAAKKGEPIPEGWALDENGAPTTDAHAALKGTMIPIGEAKGAALVLMVEIMAAAITGGMTSLEASSFLNAEGAQPDVGQFIIAISPDFVSADMFYDQMEKICGEIENEEGARLPGQRAQNLMAKIETDGGIFIDDDVLKELEG